MVLFHAPSAPYSETDGELPPAIKSCTGKPSSSDLYIVPPSNLKQTLRSLVSTKGLEWTDGGGDGGGKQKGTKGLMVVAIIILNRISFVYSFDNFI